MIVINWQLKLNSNIEQAKNNPEKIKFLIEKYVVEFAEEVGTNYFSGRNKNILDLIENALGDREFSNYNCDIFEQY
jgi:hypothetical protein